LIEQQYLTPLPARQFDYAITSLAEVNSMRLVKFDRNRYSVPVDLVGKTVTVKGYPWEVRIYHRSKEVAVHQRIYRQGETSLALEHYLPILVKKHAPWPMLLHYDKLPCSPDSPSLKIISWPEVKLRNWQEFKRLSWTTELIEMKDPS